MNDKGKQIVGNNIRALRMRLNMTQAELAQKVFRSNKSISKWESGESYPDQEVFWDLPAALECSISDIFSVNITKERQWSEQKGDINFKRARLYLNDKVMIAKNDAWLLLYKGFIFQLDKDPYEFQNLLFNLMITDPSNYESGYLAIFVETTSSIAVCYSKQKADFVSFRDLLLKAIDEIEISVDIENYTTYLQFTMLSLWGDLCQYLSRRKASTIEEMRPENCKDWAMIPCAMLLSEESERIVLEAFLKKYFYSAKSMILEDKKHQKKEAIV